MHLKYFGIVMLLLQQQSIMVQCQCYSILRKP